MIKYLMDINLIHLPVEKWLKLTKKPIRQCRWMHECCMCDLKITNGQLYYDGGYGKRSHVAHFLEASKRK